MNRYKAGLTHLSLSAVVLTISLGFILSIWYPGFYVEVEGLVPILAILLAVDLILGPLITLIIYKKGKPRLKLDLCIIVSVQLAALFYGCFSMYEARPTYLVYTGKDFHVVRSVDVIQDQLEAISDESLLTSTFESPTWIYAIGESPAIAKFMAGKLLVLSPVYYNEFEEKFDFSQTQGVPVEELFLPGAGLAMLDEIYIKQKTTADDYFYIPVLGKTKKMLMLMHKSDKTHQVIDAFALAS
ncbi:MAG: hypothetical protein COA99_09630 [Moraxellaceae bacterium]|nr:MAG: hypothetical protein COA99_09630 [Moraxellaceae bacterium]